MVIEEIPTAVAQAEAPLPPALPKHRYPLPIIAAAIAMIAAVAYSLLSVPHLVAAGRDYRAGTSALSSGDYSTAFARLSRAHTEAPTSRKILIALAEADFADGHAASGLRLLEGVKLTSSEWNGLTAYMPAQYQKYFHQTAN
jgi:hypothetical protein